MSGMTFDWNDEFRIWILFDTLTEGRAGNFGSQIRSIAASFIKNSIVDLS